MTATLPADHEAWGYVLDLPGLDELPTETPTRHVCRVETGAPLCGAELDDGTVYPFRGRRDEIRAGLKQACPDCRAEMEDSA